MEGHVSSRVWVSRESVGGRAELRMQDGIGFASDGGALPGHQQIWVADAYGLDDSPRRSANQR